MNQENLASFIWGVADILRGTLKRSQYGRVILPFTLLRRLECVLEPTREDVLKVAEKQKARPEGVLDRLLRDAAGLQFYNTSSLRLGSLSDTQTRQDLLSYVNQLSAEAREVFEYFKFEEFVDRLDAANILYPVVQRFAGTDLSPARLDNFGMGVVFEELIRKFAEDSNETAGEHFTPRDVVHLVTSLLFTDQQHRLKPGAIIKIYDPAAGTGGFLSESENYIKSISKEVDVSLHGQELNPESYAICKADMLIKGQDVANIKLGNTLSDDQHPEEKFDFLLANPPFGVDWKASQRDVLNEHERLGFNGRFGPGVPRVSDGSLLFLLHLVSKMSEAGKEPARIGIILNGSPLFTGGAGSGESEIRRYLLEHDLVEAIIALPTDMFYNTGIATYIWILSNKKPAARRGQVQLINATEHYAKMRKSLGSKRKWLDESKINEIVRLYGRMESGEECKLFPVQHFGYRRITVERPLKLNFQASPERLARLAEEKPLQKLGAEEFAVIEVACRALDAERLYRNRDTFTRDLRAALKAQDIKKPRAPILKAILSALSERDEEADVCTDSKGRPEPDTDLRDYENVPLGESIQAYFEREVKPHVPDAWIDESKRDPHDNEVGIVGYEIPFNREFYKFVPPRPLEEIDAELKQCTDRIKQMIEELSA